MKRLLILLVLSGALGLVGGVGTALAGGPAFPKEPAPPAQSADQSNVGSHSASQTGITAPIVLNASPNVALANGGSAKPSCSPCGGGKDGSVQQNSGSIVVAP